MKHKPEYCMVTHCTMEATRWVEVKRGIAKNDTFYLCQEHAEALSPNDDQIATLIPEENRIEFNDLAVYSCSDKCNECNQ